jgi:hypothetical protein
MALKTHYITTVKTDDGKVLEVSGWYWEEAPFVGEQEIREVNHVE